MEDLKNIIESLLFVAEEPLSPERIKKLVGPVEASEIHQALAALQTDYDSRRGGFFLSEVAGGFQFRTRPEYTTWIRRLVEPKPVRLSKAALRPSPLSPTSSRASGPPSNTSAGWIAEACCGSCSSAS